MPTGDRFPLVEHLDSEGSVGGDAWSASGRGRIVFRTATTVSQRQLAWVDRSGAVIKEIGQMTACEHLEQHTANARARSASAF